MPPRKKKKKKDRVIPPETGVEQIAAIDIGSSSIRLALAEFGADNKMRRHETLSQNVSIGSDTFTCGEISHETTEQCVRILTSFKRVMQEYTITQPEQIRAVATSAVREATNRDAFLDRLFMATGIQVDAIDEAETARLTYLGVQPYLSSDPDYTNTDTLVIEVGGGSTELLWVRGDDVLFSHVYPLGSLRINEALGDMPARDIQRQIQAMVDDIRHSVKVGKEVQLIFLGGEARFTARQIQPGWEVRKHTRISVKALARFKDEILKLSVDDRVREYHLNFSDAETLGVALMAYAQFAEAFDLKNVQVSGVTMRDGLLMELVNGGAWSVEFNHQILRSAKELGAKYAYAEAHADEVALLAKLLFHELQPDHQLSPRYLLLLEVAALLHEVGLFVSDRNYHKHSSYLVDQADIFGLGRRNTKLVALVVRYHTRANPGMGQSAFAALDRSDRMVVKQLSAILRIADALGASRRQRVTQISCRRDADRLLIFVPGVEDLTLEQLALLEKGNLFRDVYGYTVEFRKRAGKS
ncbi:MAG: exopolyphosphatase/guanosine-5'-triphosphate,3'-diphosphate pyrophosphatase [Kiritimatiellia bacterium]|jgi:exopolyphosphatase/guanosine-5'-triphosphate,3'-diphosphate pyrophosphatase